MTTCSDLVDEYEIGVHFCGNLKYLPKDVADLAVKVVERTKHNEKYVRKGWIVLRYMQLTFEFVCFLSGESLTFAVRTLDGMK